MEDHVERRLDACQSPDGLMNGFVEAHWGVNRHSLERATSILVPLQETFQRIEPLFCDCGQLDHTPSLSTGTFERGIPVISLLNESASRNPESHRPVHPQT